MRASVSRGAAWIAALSCLAVAPGCGKGDEVVVTVVAGPGVPAGEIADLQVFMGWAPGGAGAVTERVFAVDGELGDGSTTFSIRPGDYRGPLTVSVLARRAAGMVVASGESFTVVEGGRQLLEVTLDRPGGTDAAADAGLPDAGATDAAPLDAGSPSPCAFGAATAVDGVNDVFANEGDPALSSTGLQLLFSSDRLGAGTFDLVRSMRESVVGPWSFPVMLAASAPSPAFDGGPWLSPDGQRLYFHSTVNSGNEDLFMARFEPTAGDWLPAAEIPIVNEIASEDRDPALSADETALFFASDRGGAGTQGGMDLFTAARLVASGEFSAPVPLGPVVNSAAGEAGPALSPSGLELFFHSNRMAAGSSGGLDLWVTRRATPTGPWEPPVPLAELNLPGEDDHPGISADGFTLYFSSDRSGTSGDLYYAVRPCVPGTD